MPLTMLNLSAMRSTYRPHTQPIPLSFRQRSSDMHLGSIGSSEGFGCMEAIEPKKVFLVTLDLSFVSLSV